MESGHAISLLELDDIGSNCVNCTRNVVARVEGKLPKDGALPIFDSMSTVSEETQYENNCTSLWDSCLKRLLL
jgi:hypothetical protein